MSPKDKTLKEVFFIFILSSKVFVKGSSLSMSVRTNGTSFESQCASDPNIKRNVSLQMNE